jgi:hypothetical protein
MGSSGTDPVIGSVLEAGGPCLVARNGLLVLYEPLDEERPATRLFIADAGCGPGEATIAVTDRAVLVLRTSGHGSPRLALSLRFEHVTAIATGYSRAPGHRWPSLEFHGPNEVAVVRLPAGDLTDVIASVSAHTAVPVLPARALARPEVDAHRAPRLYRWSPEAGEVVHLRWTTSGELAMAVGSLEVGRLRSLGAFDFPLEKWWLYTAAGSAQIVAEGTRREWRFVVRTVDSGEALATARRHRWRLSRFDLRLGSGESYRLAFHAMRRTELTDHAGQLVATVDWHRHDRDPAGTITLARPSASAAQLALLLLLIVRVTLFQSYIAPGGGSVG